MKFRPSLNGPAPVKGGGGVWSILWIVLFVCIAMMAAAVVIESAENSRHHQSQKTEVLEKLSTIRARLEGALNGELLLSRSLVTVITVNGDIDQETFSRTTSTFLKSAKYIHNIALSRGTVIQYVFPLTGNERAIGLDYSKTPAQWDAVKRAMDTRKTVVAGPVRLIQGGVGIIGRTPIYVPEGGAEAGREKFFGMLAVVVDIPDLFAAAGISEDSELEISIRGKDGLGLQGEIFHGKANLFNEETVAMSVDFTDNSWYMVARPKNGWEDKSPRIFYYRIAVFFAASIILTLALLKNREEILRRKADERLFESEVRYRSLFDASADGIVLIDPETARFTHFNEQACRQLGYTRDEFAKLSIPEVELRETAEETRRRIGEVMRTGHGEFETLQKTKTGEARNVSVKARYSEINGKYLYHCIWRDVTSEKRQEQLLRSRLILIDIAQKCELSELITKTLDELENLTGSEIGFCRLIADVRNAQTLTLSTKTGGAWPLSDVGAPPFDHMADVAWAEAARQKTIAIHNGGFESEPDVRPPAGYPEARRKMIVPVVRQDEVVAIFTVGNKPTDYTDEDAKLMARFADLSWEIVERKIAEVALRESEVKFRTMFNNAPIGLLITDSRGVVIDCNTSFCEIFGADRERYIGMDLPARLPEGPVKRNLIGAMETDELQHYEGPYTSILTGRDHHLAISSIKVSKSLIFTVIGDITERKLNEELLRESEEKFAKSFQSAPLIFAIAEMESGAFIDVNEETLRLTGFKRGELVGRTPSETGLLDQENISILRREIGTKGKITNLELKFHAKDGHEIIGLVYGEKITIAGRECLLLATVDTTELRSAELERTKLQERLAQSQKMEAIGTLAGGIAHDFNNILGAIMGYTEISLMKVRKDGDVYKNLEHVIAASERAKELVQQILSFSRKGEKKIVPVEAGRLVTEVMHLLTAVIPKTINIKQDIAGDAGLVLADPTELHQVVMNLCTNAYQAMSSTGGTMKVTLQNTQITNADLGAVGPLRAGEYIRLVVADSGPGMDLATQAKIFEPYFTTKGLGKGTGLGLALVHGIVQSMNGKITVQSELGKGTTFTVLMPRHFASAPVQPEPAKLEASHAEARIILVDDEPGLAYLGRQMLESHGFSVRESTDPYEALSLFQQSPGDFDALVTDQTMPGLTGSELIAKFRAIRPDMPTVMCTGYSDLIDEEGAKSRGVTAFVRKPYDINTIVTAVMRALAVGKGSA